MSQVAHLERANGKTILPVTGNSCLRDDDKLICDIDKSKTKIISGLIQKEA